MKFKLARSENIALEGCVGALDVICMKIAKPNREINPAFFTVTRDNTRCPCKDLTLTTFLDMPLVSVDELHTLDTTAPKRDRKLKQKTNGLPPVTLSRRPFDGYCMHI